MLVKCRECGKDMSSDADACPHCGAPPKAQMIAKGVGAIGWLVLVVGLLVFFIWLRPVCNVFPW